MALLEVNDIHTYYGNIHALKGVSFEVDTGEIIALIGSNGAGKTTTLRTISGLMEPREGAVYYEDEDISNTRADLLVSKGISMVPEGRGVFAKLTVEENLDMGAYIRRDSGIKDDLAGAFELFPRLEERKKQVAGTLSGGEQQMLAIARALMSKPRLLLLDEPSMGLAPVLVDGVFDTIQRIANEGVTILLVEQNAHMALQIADRGYVLQSGEVAISDTAANLQQNETVQKTYLGID
ncbi:MAG: ABC transporter ATP-binding protein [Chloroflexota bacterium]|nr:ABC transporter ATP-binding protein [Chloroflexota bacterium]MDE2854522.1 ABC transporter ATP-binding protein [Chloroflexota bacterium]MDE2945948.1 ABC transporter ATP-binding protein [Chloroflexota bacterium]